MQETLVGVMDFNHGEERIIASKEKLEKIYIFCQQVAGIIHSHNLLKLVSEEKDKALIAKQQIEEQNQETEKLNNLVKSLNEELDLKVIMEKVTEYVNKNYSIQNIGLYVVEPDKKHS